MKIIVINGAGTSGKDTFIDLFTEVVKEEGNYSVYRFSSVDEIKHYAKYMGWDGVKDDKGRKFLSDIKDALTLYCDGPFNYMKDRVNVIESLGDSSSAYVFFHVREPVEIKKMVDRLSAITLLIERPSVNNEDFTNHADKNVRNYKYDYQVLNDGTLSDLKDSARLFFEFLSCL